MQQVDVPRTMRQHYSNAELSANVMFLNNVTFLTSISELVHCTTSNAADTLRRASLEYKIKNVIRSHAIRGFQIVVAGEDIKFKALKDWN